MTDPTYGSTAGHVDPGADPHVDSDTVAPSHDDPFVRHGSTLLGGPLGRHGVASRAVLTPVTVVLLLTALVSLLGFVQKAPCLTHAWTHEYQYTRVCYSDVYALYYSEQLNAGKVPYRDHAVEYPVVIGGMMEVAAQAAQLAPHDGNTDNRAAWFFTVTAAMLGASAIVLALATSKLAGRRPWDAALFALAPVLVFHAYTNWDLAAAALTGLAMWAWARDHAVLAGVLIGLGTATKLYPLLVLVALFPLCLRAHRLRPWARSLASGVGAWVVVNAPVWLLWPHSWSAFWRLNDTRGADWDSLWFQLQRVTVGRSGSINDQLRSWFHLGAATGSAPTALNVAWVSVVVALFLGIFALTLRAPRRPRVPQVLFLLIVAFLLGSKVYSPQYVLWYLPVAVLALPRWRTLLAWQATEIALLFARYFYFINVDKGESGAQGISADWFFAAVWVRDIALLVISALVVRDMLQPWRDPVRRSGMDDPAGGPLDERSAADHPADPVLQPA